MLDNLIRRLPLLLAVIALAAMAGATAEGPMPNDARWRLPPVPFPAGNAPTPSRTALGQRLFFDPQLSKDGAMSCATCHDPAKGWADGLATARGFAGKVLPRATPSIVNTAFARSLMWDGSATSLEAQAMKPLESSDEMAADLDDVLRLVRADANYRQAFALAYPGEPIDRATLAKAIASFERTVTVTRSPFDDWLAGQSDAITAQQIRGFRIFTSADKGNCETCHQAPNFSDDGFHNIGLASFGAENPDLGRYVIRAVAVNKGAFRTPGLRGVGVSSHYFHDGSALSLGDVVEHYVKGGSVRTNLSANMKPLVLTAQEKEDLVAFLSALTTTPLAISSAARNAADMK